MLWKMINEMPIGIRISMALKSSLIALLTMEIKKLKYYCKKKDIIYNKKKKKNKIMEKK